MTKFEEELRNKGVEIITQQPGCSMSRKVLINYADVVNLSEGWVSPEEHQARVDELIEAKEKYTKLLYENSSLKSQLQQQALPVVPECVAKDIEKLKSFNKDGKNFHVFDLSYYSEESVNWVEYDYDNYVKFYLAVVTCKYEVEKPQLFYLKNKLTTSYLELDKTNDYFHHTMNPAPYYDMTRKSQFTQQEIDSMQTGSYEQIEVTE